MEHPIPCKFIKRWALYRPEIFLVNSITDSSIPPASFLLFIQQGKWERRDISRINPTKKARERDDEELKLKRE